MNLFLFKTSFMIRLLPKVVIHLLKIHIIYKIKKKSKTFL